MTTIDETAVQNEHLSCFWQFFAIVHPMIVISIILEIRNLYSIFRLGLLALFVSWIDYHSEYVTCSC